MLIGVIQPTQDGKQVDFLGALRSEVIRLCSPDDCRSISGHPFYSAIETTACLELRLGWDIESVFEVLRNDREERRILSSLRRNGDGNVVERRAEIVRHVSKE